MKSFSAGVLIGLSFTISLLTGCAGNPPVQLAAGSKSQFDGAVYAGETAELAKPTPNAEVYRAFYQGGSGFVSVNSVREEVEEMADKQCARKGLVPRPIREITSKPPHVLGNFPRVEWLFECVPSMHKNSAEPMSSDKLEQLERLKRLLDSNALTQEEFASEKAKILGGP